MIFPNGWQQAILNQNWANVPGNSQEFERYAGIETGNPSGNTENIKYIFNKDSMDVVKNTTEFQYDADDIVTNIIAREGDPTA